MAKQAHPYKEKPPPEVTKLAELEETLGKPINQWKEVPSLSDDEEFVACLSSIMNGSDTCTAIYLSKDQILVSSNRPSDHQTTPSSAQEMLNSIPKLISKLAKDPKNSVLQSQVQEQIIDQILKTPNSNYHTAFGSLNGIVLQRLSDSSDSQEITSLRENIKNFSKGPNNAGDLKTGMEQIHTILTSTDPSLKPAQEILKRKGDLSLYSDVEAIIYNISENKLSPELMKILQEEKWKYLDNPQEKHAEMILLPEAIGNGGLIATSKLCCNSCKTFIDTVNSNTNQKIEVIGTHGKTYHGWLMPDINNKTVEADKIVKDFLEKIDTQGKQIQTKMDKTRAEVKNRQVDDEGFTLVMSKKQIKSKIIQQAGEGYSPSRSDAPTFKNLNSKYHKHRNSNNMVQKMRQNFNPSISNSSLRPIINRSTSLPSKYNKPKRFNQSQR